MVVAEHITKQIGEDLILSDLSLQISEGQATGILGKQSSGKTTLFNILTGCCRPNEGKITLLGNDLYASPVHARRTFGYAPERPALFFDMTLLETLSFACRLRGISDISYASSLALMKTGLSGVSNRLVDRLTREERRRANLAQALLGSPKLLFLDEPTLGLETREAEPLLYLIKQLRRECTIVLGSSKLSEVTDICDRALILAGGKIAADKLISDFASLSSEVFRIRVRVQSSVSQAKELLAAVGHEFDASSSPCAEPGALEYVVECDAGDDLRAKLWAASARLEIPILEMRRISLSLDDLYLQLSANGGR